MNGVDPFTFDGATWLWMVAAVNAMGAQLLAAPEPKEPVQ